MIRKAGLCLIGLCYLATVGMGQEALSETICAENAMIVFDGSASMANSADPGGEARISTARKAIAEVLPDVTRRRRNWACNLWRKPSSARTGSRLLRN